MVKAGKALNNSRIRKTTNRQKKQIAKKDARTASQMPTSFKLVGQVYSIFRANWRKLLGIVIVYLVLNVIFASSFGSLSTTIGSIKDNLQAGGKGSFSAAFSGFGSLVGSAGTSSSQTGSILQSLLFIVESLVIIWALRQILAGEKITVKESYYRSMMPFIPFLLVLGVILLQLLPVIAGTAIVSAILSAIFNSSGLLTFIFVICFMLLAAWSIYMISSSIFALYIVTLPEMEPLQALRSAKNLVKFKRWLILRRLLFLPIFIFVVMAIIIVPLILTATFLVAPLFYFLGMLTILFIHSYLYSLYRSLLD